jgi:hypothetical protein
LDSSFPEKINMGGASYVKKVRYTHTHPYLLPQEGAKPIVIKLKCRLTSCFIMTSPRIENL